MRCGDNPAPLCYFSSPTKRGRARTGRLLGLTSGQGVSFTDMGKFADWAGSEIAFVSGLVDPVNSNRVMNGISADKFSPQSTYTREQAIMTSLRLFHCAA